jgi:diguanylate cyclase (GGDEF) domain
MLHLKPTICWGLELSDTIVEKLRKHFDDTVSLVLWDKNNLPGPFKMNEDSPVVLFASATGEKVLQGLPQGEQQYFMTIPRVLLLEKGYTLADINTALDGGVTEIIKPPHSRKQVWSVLLKAHEAQTIHRDMQVLTRQILLEREIMERKNDILSFLVSFLSESAQNMDEESILQNAFTGLTRMMPASSMNAVIWHDAQGGQKQIKYYIDAKSGSNIFKKWQMTLYGECLKYMGSQSKFKVVEHNQLHIADEEYSPDSGEYLTLPISNGKETNGILLLVNNSRKNLGRDQTEALSVALNHLSLQLGNAYKFTRARAEADVDVLTSLYNRRHFETRMNEELHRVARYGQPMALMMIDIDHFKKINDTYGHQTGDLALKKLASVIEFQMRTTDYCARYGGEEFCAILPSTDRIPALLVAERLRHAVEKMSFASIGGENMKLTVSIGISYATKDAPKSLRTIIHEADSHLYAAKARGRNRVEEMDTTMQKLQVM